MAPRYVAEKEDAEGVLEFRIFFNSATKKLRKDAGLGQQKSPG